MQVLVNEGGVVVSGVHRSISAFGFNSVQVKSGLVFSVTILVYRLLVRVKRGWAAQLD